MPANGGLAESGAENRHGAGWSAESSPLNGGSAVEGSQAPAEESVPDDDEPGFRMVFDLELDASAEPLRVADPRADQAPQTASAEMVKPSAQPLPDEGDEPVSTVDVAASTKRSATPSERGKMGGRPKKDKPLRKFKKVYLDQSQMVELERRASEAGRSASSYLRALALGDGAADEAKVSDLISILISAEQSVRDIVERLRDSALAGREAGLDEVRWDEIERELLECVVPAQRQSLQILKGLTVLPDDDEEPQGKRKARASRSVPRP